MIKKIQFISSLSIGSINRFVLILLLIFPSICFSLSLSDTTNRKKTNEFTGTASFYSNKFQGKKTANGEVFSQKMLTAACNKLPLGTKVKVINLKNNNEVILKINDRLHARNSRLIDVTMAAARKLGFEKSGITRVKVIVLKKDE